LRLVALEDRIDAELRLGRHRELVAELEGLVRDHPLSPVEAASKPARSATLP
jgi:Bacterial transcriptional activator domain